jgi:dephospho-CoA kinase
MPGSGKSIVSEAAASAGYRVIAMGDIIREEAESRGIAKTPASLGSLMLELRSTEGNDVIAKRCLDKARERSSPMAIEGVRSLDELDFFKSNGGVMLIAVHASPKTRFQRLLKRGRADDPDDWATFFQRDMREIAVGIGSVIALADKVFINEGTVEVLLTSAKDYFEGIRNDVESQGSRPD